MAAWVWVLIPITAILVGAFNEWLKFKAKQQQLGTSTFELEKTVAVWQQALEASEKERATLQRRVQNLETIVTGEMWDALHDDTLSGTAKEHALADARAQLLLPEEEPDAEKIARLARRLKS